MGISEVALVGNSDANDLSESAAHRDVFSPCVACGCSELGEYLRAPDRFYGRATTYRLVRCHDCGLVSLASPPEKNAMHEHYGREYDAFIARASDSASAERWRGALETLAKYKRGGALLDLGCGTGSFLKRVDRRSWNLHGIELSKEAAVDAERRTGARVFNGDILDAPFSNCSFDAVTCFHVFEHVHEPAQVMQKVWRWLKPGGIFYLHVPNIDAAEARIFRSFWYGLELPRHLYHFSPESLASLGNACGYEILETVTQRVSFIEYSVRYICDDLLHRAGISRKPLALAPNPGVAWRILRKALRMTLLPLASAVISIAGEGQIVETVLRKAETNLNRNSVPD